MTTKIKYNNATIASLEVGQTATLPCANKLMQSDIVVTAGSGGDSPVTDGTEGLQYTLSNDGTYYICTGLGTATDLDIVIASHYNGLPVKEIDDGAFRRKGITSVVIPDTVLVIKAAFNECDVLTSVDMGNGVIFLGKSSFVCSNLTNLTLPNSIRAMNDSAIKCWNLTTINFEGTTTEFQSIFKSCDGTDAFWINAPATVVNCTDGKVRISTDQTITN